MPTKKPTRNTLFWSNWKKVELKLMSEAGHSKKEVEEERQEMLRMCGAKADEKGRFSTTKLNNSQFNAVLDYCDMILGKPTKKRRSAALIYSIKKLGVDDAELNKVSNDIFKQEDWQKLTLDQLTKFRFTATRMSRQKTSN